MGAKIKTIWGDCLDRNAERSKITGHCSRLGLDENIISFPEVGIKGKLQLSIPTFSICDNDSDDVPQLLLKALFSSEPSDRKSNPRVSRSCDLLPTHDYITKGMIEECSSAVSIRGR